MEYKRIRPKNIVYLLISFFMPIHYLNTFIIYNDDKLIISRYYVKNKKMKKDILEIFINEVNLIGFIQDLNISSIEILSGPSGVYIPQEICFLLKNGKVVSFNAKPYTKKQCIEILNLFKCDKGKQLNKILGL